MSQYPVAIGIDLGGSHLRAALVDSADTLVRVIKQPITDRSPKGLVSQLTSAIQALYLEANAPAASLPLGMGIAAFLRSSTGHILLSPNLGWKDVPFGAMLTEALRQPVALINDLNAITLGEARTGAARGITNVLCIFVGTGIGLGVMIAGCLLEGAHGMATELGHVKIVYGADAATARLCGCGARGCLEAYTSGRYLPELVVAYAHAGMRTRLLQSAHGSLTAINATTVEAAALQRDPVAMRVWDDVADRLGTAIANAITLFDPEVVVLGGGMLEAAPSLAARLQRSILATLSPPYRDALSSLSQPSLRIVPSQLADHAGLIGAAWWARTQKRLSSSF